MQAMIWSFVKGPRFKLTLFAASLGVIGGYALAQSITFTVPPLDRMRKIEATDVRVEEEVKESKFKLHESRSLTITTAAGEVFVYQSWRAAHYDDVKNALAKGGAVTLWMGDERALYQVVQEGRVISAYDDEKRAREDNARQGTWFGLIALLLGPTTVAYQWLRHQQSAKA